MDEMKVVALMKSMLSKPMTELGEMKEQVFPENEAGGYNHLTTGAQGEPQWNQYAYTTKHVKIKHTEDYSKGELDTPGSGGSALVNGLARLIKVSDYVPSKEEIFSDDFSATFMNVDKTEVKDVDDYKWDYPDYYGRYQLTNINGINPATGTRSWPAFVVVPEAAKVIVLANTMILDCYEPGVYMWAGSYGKNFGYCEFECSVSVPMDSRVPYIEEAQAGQAAVVKAVDESGKPTEWETADVAFKSEVIGSRITSLDNTQLAGYMTFEAAGIPEYVEDVSAYSSYGITETGWYLFVRIAAKSGVVVSDDTTVAGAAGYIATPGAAYVDVAVRFDVAAQSQTVTVTWANGNAEKFVFKATDLAVRNLDYRTTFYVYDIAEFATWSYTAATDTTAVGTAYYTLADGVYTQAAVKAYESIPANTYYTLADGVYTLTTDLTFVGKAYFEESDGVYTQVAVAAGEAISGLYVHSGVTFEGMARNITYKCDTIIDCPTTYVLPEIESDIHGCWYEVRFRYDGTHSNTLQVPDGVKVAIETSQSLITGLNMVNLHYTDVGGAKIWRFVNMHSTIPA